MGSSGVGVPGEARAVIQNCMEKLLNLVCEGATKEQWAEWLRVPLEHAAAAGDTALVSDLLEAGANGKAGWKGCLDRSLLCAAVQGGERQVVSALLTAGAQPDVNVCSGEKQRSALHHASSGGHDTIAKLLLVAGADVGCVDSDKSSPLHLAVRGGHEGVVLDLLGAGASPNCQDEDGDGPIHIAARLGHAELVSLLLLSNADVNILDSEGRSPLHLAAEHGHLSAVKTLLRVGADVSLRSSNNWSALDIVTSGGHVDVMRALLQHGADVRSRGPPGYTVLHLAAEVNQARAVDVLVEAGTDIEARLEEIGNKTTPLHVAALNGNCNALVALLRHNANVHTRDRVGRSPLMLACAFLKEEAAKLLLRWGADETSIDSDGESAEELIGRALMPDYRQHLAEDMERLRRLLVRAPADRAWRRRGLLVMCRAFLDKDGFGSISNQPLSDEVDEAASEDGTNKHGKTEGSVGSKADSDVDTTSKATASIETTGAEASCRLRGVEAWVINLEQDELFRLIISFL